MILRRLASILPRQLVKLFSGNQTTVGHQRQATRGVVLSGDRSSWSTRQQAIRTERFGVEIEKLGEISTPVEGQARKLLRQNQAVHGAGRCPTRFFIGLRARFYSGRLRILGVATQDIEAARQTTKTLS